MSGFSATTGGTEPTWPLPRAGWPTRILLIGLTLAALSLAWFPLMPKYLYDFDSANFALALTQFDPGLYRPQPPGYPLYVALTRLINVFVPDAKMVFFVSGLLGAALAVTLAWLLGDRMFGRKAGIAAAALLLVNPVLWKAGLSGQVRIYLAVTALSVALVAWHAWQNKSAHLPFFAAFLVLGFAVGFRPASAVLFMPLLIAVGVRQRRTPSEFILAGFNFSVGVAPWLLITVVKAGGATRYLDILHAYLRDQTGGTSILYGASAAAAWGMLSQAAAWTGLGALSWIWAAPFVPWRSAAKEWREAGPFLLLWFCPAFLFLAFVHAGAPGHTLIVIPALCLAGGWVLSRFASHAGVRFRQAGWAAMVLALALNIWWFFRPFSVITQDSSYRPVKRVDCVTTATLERIEQLKRQGPIYLVAADALPVSWLQLSYYFPDVPLLVLLPLEPGSPSPPVWLIKNTVTVAPQLAANQVVLPSCGTIVWVLPLNSPLRYLLRDVMSYRERELVLDAKAEPGLQFQLGAYRFVTDVAACGSKP